MSTSSKRAGRSTGQVFGILAGLVVVLGAVQYGSASSDNTCQANGYAYTVSGADAPVADGYSKYPVYPAEPVVETIEPAAPVASTSVATPITQAWLDANHARVEAVAKAAIDKAGNQRVKPRPGQWYIYDGYGDAKCQTIHEVRPYQSDWQSPADMMDQSPGAWLTDKGDEIDVDRPGHEGFPVRFYRTLQACMPEQIDGERHDRKRAQAEEARVHKYDAYR